MNLILITLTISTSFGIVLGSILTRFVPVQDFNSGKYDPQEMAAVELDGSPVYIGRVEYGEGHQIGMYCPKLNGFFYVGDDLTTKSLPMTSNTFEVLVYARNSMSWIYFNNERTLQESPPPNMVVLGLEPSTGEPIYGCRAHGWGHIHFGTTLLSNPQGCRITRGNAFYWNKEMEVMTFSLFGISNQSVD